MQAQTPEVSAEQATTPPAIEDRTIYECTGCGTVTRDRAAQMALYKRAGALSCCPERNMVPVKLAEPAPAQDEREALREQQPAYVECRECTDCGHVGINDAHQTDATCAMCDWSGPSPVEDQCPDCGKENVMGAACPKCSGRYRILAETHVAAPIAQTEQVEALRESERFIAGFEGCELQEGIDALLAKIRAALAAQGGDA